MDAARYPSQRELGPIDQSRPRRCDELFVRIVAIAIPVLEEPAAHAIVHAPDVAPAVIAEQRIVRPGLGLASFLGGADAIALEHPGDEDVELAG